jgi:hypothetical protein
MFVPLLSRFAGSYIISTVDPSKIRTTLKMKWYMLYDECMCMRIRNGELLDFISSSNQITFLKGNYIINDSELSIHTISEAYCFLP